MNHSLTPEHGLHLAIAASGGSSEMARRLRIRPQQVSKWKRRGRIPLLRVHSVSKMTGIPAHLLRPDQPDLFPPPRIMEAELHAA